MLSRQNIRGIVTIVIMAVVIVLLLYIGKPRVEYYIAERNKVHTTEQSLSVEQRRDTLFVFDPNTVSYEQLRLLGLDKRTAVGIIKYRTGGKVFSIVEDFALCYGVSDSIYARLKPYIRIADKFKLQPQPKSHTADTKRESRFSPRPFEPFRIDTVGVEYLRKIGFSTRQARTLIEYRDRNAEGILDMNELRDCYAVSKEMADSLQHFIIFPEPKPYGGKVEINSADSAALRSVAGIGTKTVVAIMEYRKLLGGFYSIEQIAELKCVTNENFERISKQICCDSCVISKIDINFATASELEYHPYMTRQSINRIEQLRKSKGGWKSIEEMMNDKIFFKEQAEAIAPYLHFGDIPLDFSK
ncbi:MAG: helix-hairpin-helix domain-containing protein [Alistipes sp.]|nr:helix-hairpin-helix domain-containing protein [Alistipes sp.]